MAVGFMQDVSGDTDRLASGAISLWVRTKRITQEAHGNNRAHMTAHVLLLLAYMGTVAYLAGASGVAAG